MIKSGTWSSPANAKAGNKLAFVFLGVMAASGAAGLFDAKIALTPLTILVWRGVLVALAMLLIVFWRRIFSKNREMDEMTSVYTLAIAGTVGGFIFSLFNIWLNDPAGTILGAGQMAQYIFTLGTSPRLIGPDVFLRGMAWTMAVVTAVISYKKDKDIFRSLIDAVGTWVAASLAFVLPSIILMATLILTGVGGGDVVQDFSRVAVNSYWNNGQLIRWFTGFGNQLSNTYVLYAGSIIFVLTAGIWGLLFAKERCVAIYKNLRLQDYLLLILAMSAGLTAGWGRAPWTSIDFAAWCVLITLLCAVVSLWADWKIVANQDRSWLWFFVIMGAALLGWPIMLITAVAVSIAYVDRKTEDFGVSKKWRWLTSALFWFFIAALAMVFTKRGGAVNFYNLQLLGGVSIFFIPVVLAETLLEIKAKWLILGGVWLTASLISGLLFGTFAPIAITLLSVALTHIALRIKPWILSFTPLLICLIAMLILLAVVWLPRLANPKLIPM